MPELKHLFQPLTIANFTVKNRIVFTPHGSGLRYLQELARGGVGMIGMNTGGAAYSVQPGLFHPDLAPRWDTHPPDPTTAEGQAFLDRAIPNLRKITDALHAEGTKVYGQVYNAGAGAHADNMAPAIGVSEVPEPFDMNIPHVMTTDEVGGVIEAYAHGIRRVKAGGFDAAELHGAHGYLICEFLSPKFNNRTDKFGGSRDNRARFVLDILAGARRLAGADFPVGIRVGLDGDGHNGLTIEELAEIAKLLAPHVAFINVSGGNYTGLGDGLEIAYVSPWYVRPAHNAASAAAIKKAVGSLPVFVGGKITDPVLANELIADGSVDMVGVARALTADPDWAKKAQAGQVEEIRRCVGMNECHYIGAHRKPNVSCAVNAAAGREEEMERMPMTTNPKRVMVIGGGPAGMEAARVAALRGHQVTLYDRAPALGGTVRILAMDPNRRILNNIAEYFERQLPKAGVTIRLGEEVTPEMVARLNPDAVVVATGAVAHVPNIPGITSPHVVTGVRVLAGDAKVGQKVLVVGEMDNHIAAGTLGEFLADRGKQVEVITEQVDWALGAEHPTRYVLLKRLLTKGVTLSTMTRLNAVDGYTAILLHTFTRKERHEPFDSIVLAAGRRANSSLGLALKGKVKELMLIGDSLAPRRVMHATLDGARAGRAL